MELQREPQEPKVFILRLIFCRSHCWVQDRSNLIDGNDAQSKRDVLLSNQIRPEMIIFDSKWILNFENMESKPSPYKKRWQACLVRNKTDMASMLSPLYHQYGKHTWSLSWPKWQTYLASPYNCFTFWTGLNETVTLSVKSDWLKRCALNNSIIWAGQTWTYREIKGGAVSLVPNKILEIGAVLLVPMK